MRLGLRLGGFSLTDDCMVVAVATVVREAAAVELCGRWQVL